MTDVTIHDRKPPIVILRDKLESRKDELQKALVDIDADHFIRTMITAATIDPNLQACSFNSLWIACLRACRDQLLPDGREGVIIPFKDKATWVPMYQGLLKRFRDSGECKWITANVVREGEIFEHHIDETGEHFRHVPCVGRDLIKNIDCVYAAALTKDNAFYVAVMSMWEIEEIKKESKANRPDSPWQKHSSEMMKKTALRRLSKLLPAGRNIFQQEEEQEREQSPTAPQLAVDNERPAGAAAALDVFAGSPEPPPHSEPGAMEDALSIAFERGQIARQTGAARRAVPGEYREEANKAEADAWLKGYDGKDGPGDPHADEVP